MGTEPTTWKRRLVSTGKQPSNRCGLMPYDGFNWWPVAKIIDAVAIG
jgi:hypothetical protein